MDLSHSAWSDIFFLGMDFPEGARVLNISIDLGVRGRDDSAASPGRGLSPRDRRAGPASRQRRSGRARRHHQPRRGVRFCTRLPGAAQGRADRFRPRPARDGRLGGASHRAPRAVGGTGPRPRAGQQRQRHPQGIAPGRLHQPARLPDRLLHARDRAGPFAHRAVGRARAPAGGCAGHPGRMARRIGRRLARLRRGVAGHQVDHGRAVRRR